MIRRPQGDGVTLQAHAGRTPLWPFPLALVLAALGTLGGCMSSEVIHIPAETQRDLLPFLEPGETTRAEALAGLGPPSASFESERIVTYRMEVNDGHRLEVAPRLGNLGWKAARYSLVLVFGETGILEKARLIQVKGPVE